MNIKKVLKKVAEFASDTYDRVYEVYKTAGFYNYYNHEEWTEGIPETLTDEEKEQIDKFYLENYGKKHPYWYHRVFKFYSGKFQLKYFPDDLVRAKISRYVNDDDFINVISDKNFLPIVAKAAGVKMPETILLSVRDIFFDADRNIYSEEEAVKLLTGMTDVLIKPTVETGAGTNVLVVDEQNGYPGLTEEQVRDIFKKYKTDFVVQRLIKNHESIAELYPDSLNTFRVITYVFDGKVEHTPSMMRIGGGGTRVDNASVKGGVQIGLDDYGTLPKYAKDGWQATDILAHPDTGAVFEGHKIELFPKVIEAAERMHRYIPQIGIFNWDFAIDEEGDPILIEANCRWCGGFSMVQYCNGKSMFGDNTEAILQWLAKTEKMPKSKRKKLKVHM